MTCIYEIIEYQPDTCFEQFGNKVFDTRLEGDRDNTCTIKSDTIKLLGNAAYGKTLTNKVKHVNVTYVGGFKTGKLVNNPRFKRLSEVALEIFEVETERNDSVEFPDAYRIIRVPIQKVADVGILLRFP